MRISILLFGILISTFFNISIVLSGSNPFIDSLRPKQNEVNVSRGSDIIVYFATDMNISTLNNINIRVHASQTGLLNVAISYEPILRKLILSPYTEFKAGEYISVHLSSEIKTSINFPILPFVYCFIAGTNEMNSYFTRKSAISTGSGPRFLATGDFDHDGDIDIAVSNYTSGNVAILKNAGNGTFTIVQSIIFRKAHFIITFDYNCDGYLDLIVTRQSYDIQSEDSAGVMYYKNNGSGSFSKGGNILYNSGAAGSDAISAIDFNGDGFIDIASNIIENQNPGIPIFKNLAGLAFFVNTMASSAVNSLMTTGDFNNDGNMDLAIESNICFNNGIGGFYSGTFISGDVWDLINSDFNKDGFSDIAGLYYNSAKCPVFKNNGNGFYSYLSNNTVGNGPIYLTSGDYNGDGNIDIAVANRSSNYISILKNSGLGTFTSTSVNNTMGTFFNGINSSDFDNDGDLDIAAVNISTNNITIFFNDKDVSVNNNNEIPFEYELLQNYPNPFNPSTVIGFELPTRNHVNLKIFNALGTEVQVLINEIKNAGNYEVEWDASKFSNGIYFYTLESDTYSSTKKMILIK